MCFRLPETPVWHHHTTVLKQYKFQLRLGRTMVELTPATPHLDGYHKARSAQMCGCTCTTSSVRDDSSQAKATATM